MPKKITERLKKKCVVCGNTCNVIVYSDRTYRGGHYFGKIPVSTKKEIDKALAAGTRKETINGFTINVMKKDPKPYKHEEYWECPKCYWKK